MKKLLFVVDERRMGGVSTVLNDLLNLLDLSRYSVDVLVLHDNGDQLDNLASHVSLRFGTPYFSGIDYTIKEALKSGNIKTLYHKVRVVYAMKTKRVLLDIKKQRKRMNLPQYDIEIAFKDGFSALFTAAGNAKRKIHWLHYEYSECNPNAKYKDLFIDIFKGFDKIVGVSYKVIKAFNEIYHLECKSEVIANVINVKRIQKLAQEDKNVNLDVNKINLISVGRLHSVKAYDRLIDIIHNLEDQYKNKIQVDIYGDGPEMHNLQSHIEQNDLNAIIHLKGSSKNPYAIMKHYDANLVVSKFEAFGLSVVESMLVKVPVCATRTAAVDQLIQNDQNGFICDNNDDSIKNMIENVCCDKQRLLKYKKNLMNYSYDNDTIIKQIENLFNGGVE